LDGALLGTKKEKEKKKKKKKDQQFKKTVLHKN